MKGVSNARFEVAVIRKATEGITTLSPPESGHINYEHVTLHLLISIAFGVDSQSIESHVPWLSEQQYSVRAQGPNGVPFSPDAFRQAMQTLLRERFHLQTHQEQRLESGYELVIASGGIKLSPTDKASAMAYIWPTRIVGKGIPLKNLAGMLRTQLGRPVVDHTGILQNYDIDLAFAPANGSESSLPSLPTALRQNCGLELKSAKVPETYLVVDSADREPVED